MTEIIQLDPKQALALDNYRNPRSATFGNLSQSMIKAGFGVKYSTTMAKKDHPQWLTQGVLDDVQLLQKSERTLHYHVGKRFKDGKKSSGDIDEMKMGLDASKFVLKTLGKSKYDSKEEERDTNVQVNIVNYTDKEQVVDVEVDK